MEGGEPVLLTHERSEGQDHFQLPTTAVAGWCAGGALTGAGEYSVWATYSEERPKIREKLCGAATLSKCPPLGPLAVPEVAPGRSHREVALGGRTQWVTLMAVGNPLGNPNGSGLGLGLGSLGSA